jgi:hypothetical protein
MPATGFSAGATKQEKGDPPETNPKEKNGEGAEEKSPSIRELDRQRRLIRRFHAGLRDPDLANVKAAVDGLVKVGSPLGAKYLWQLYSVGFGPRRRLALDGLSKLKAPKEHERVFEASLRESLLALRRLAADILCSKIGRGTVARKYHEVAQDPGKYGTLYRFRAVQLLAHVGGPNTGIRLLKCLDDKCSDVAVAAAEGLATLGGLRHVPAMVRMLETKDPELAPALADALGQLTGTANRYNLVKWEQWEEDYKAGRITPRKKKDPEGSLEEGGDTYNPDYRDPYVDPVTKSALDFVVVHDTTASLRRIWLKVIASVDAVIREMGTKTPSVRLGVVRYRAEDPQLSLEYSIKPLPLTRKLEAAREFLREATFGGESGGWNEGLKYAVSHFTWRANARKILLVVGDTTPQAGKRAAAYQLVKDAWDFDRIQCNALLILTAHHPGNHKGTYGQLARWGSGRFYQYLRNWGHLGDLTSKSIDPGKKLVLDEAELPRQTLKKWLTPVTYPKDKKK